MLQVPHHGTDPQLRVLPGHGGDGAHLPPGQGLRVQAPPHRLQQEVGWSLQDSRMTDDSDCVFLWQTERPGGAAALLAGGRGHLRGRGAGAGDLLDAAVPGQAQVALVLQKVASELHPKVHNHGEGPY